jgi:hypothetical protein
MIKPQSNPMPLSIHLQNRHLDPLSLGEHLAGVLRTSLYLGDMNQAINAILEMSERAIGHNARDHRIDLLTRLIPLVNVFPGIGLQAFETEGNATIFLI